MSTKITLPKDVVVPNHIAMILDGNRRWARSRGLHTLQGHKAGFEAGLRIAQAARDWGVHTFTVWGFSTENWDRDPKEVAYLMTLYKGMAAEVEKRADIEQIRFVHLGRKDDLPKDLVNTFKKLEEKTKNYKKHVFNAAINYGGHDEILRATRKIIKDGVKAEDLDEKKFASYLDTGDQPYPMVDLFIRTSGEQRTSGFLPWQLNYAEYYWELGHLPDMTPEKLRDVIIDYSRRRRRFGGNDAMEHFAFDPKLVAKLELRWWRLGKIPEGTKLRTYALNHIKEQFGLSTKLAKEAAKYLTEALIFEEKDKLDKAKVSLKKFYKLLKFELKLAFEPEIVASLEIESDKQKGENEELTKEHLAEVYRISLFQAAKAAHLRVLANSARNKGDWNLASDYLQKYYHALKERVA
jgi:undecaprenyl diphosphate synthase